ncbi:hypothetical protein, partial [Streptomyces sp. BE303]|uniref:hypothetical protein n=1 Tax=Streptomyces sp. BE303 TaxID=3002528 RepID=UPI002E75E697
VAVTAPLLRRARDDVTTALTALATLLVNGVPVDWSPLFTGVRPAELPAPHLPHERPRLDAGAPAGSQAAGEAAFWAVGEPDPLEELVHPLLRGRPQRESVLSDRARRHRRDRRL